MGNYLPKDNINNIDYYNNEDKVPVRFSDLQIKMIDDDEFYQYQKSEDTEKMKIRPKGGDWDKLVED